jgi:integrase
MKTQKNAHGLIASIAATVREHGHARAGGGKVGDQTREKRASVIFLAFRQLRDMGYKLESCQQLAGRHVTALCQRWDREGLAASTIAGRLSVLRLYSSWIHKPGLVRSAAYYLGAERVRRSTINQVDRSWPVDPVAKIEEIRKSDPRFAIQLDLERVFSMRPGEAIQFKPFLGDVGNGVVAIRWGTKGGRERFEVITNDEQRRVLDLAKTFATNLNASTSDQSVSLKTARGRYWRNCARFGLTRKSGMVSYGLRHGRSADRYKELTGSPAPVRGGGAIDPELDEYARRVIGSGLGHSRINIVAAYIGKAGKKNERASESV